ncbi:MAG: carboxypeptidase regulatory-like domain-containing protein, partial [Proteobacteria bacterium]|nr:carboxypeptidase regulatory-like domain-containing protein [Pseudomonadota bacterium]
MKKVVFIIAIAIVVIIAGILLFLTPAKTNVEALDAPASTNTKSDAHDETITNALSGTVLDGITKKPIAAKITVKDKKQILKSTDCNASGEYSFALPYGKYQLSAEFPGYVPLGKFDISHPIEIDENTQKLKKIYL